MTNYLIPCQHCGKMLPQDWRWFICDKCGSGSARIALAASWPVWSGLQVQPVSVGQMKGAR